MHIDRLACFEDFWVERYFPRLATRGLLKQSEGEDRIILGSHRSYILPPDVKLKLWKLEPDVRALWPTVPRYARKYKSHNEHIVERSENGGSNNNFWILSIPKEGFYEIGTCIFNMFKIGHLMIFARCSNLGFPFGVQNPFSSLNTLDFRQDQLTVPGTYTRYKPQLTASSSRMWNPYVGTCSSFGSLWLLTRTDNGSINGQTGSTLSLNYVTQARNSALRSFQVS